MMSAIETLNRGPTTPFLLPHARTFNLLHLHYVEGMTIQETARELGLSERQAYRDLRQADAAIAALLWAKRSIRPPLPATSEPDEHTMSSVEAEMDRLPSSAQSMELGGSLHRARGGRSAAQRGVTLLSTIPANRSWFLRIPCWRNILHPSPQPGDPTRPARRATRAGEVQAEGATATLRYRPEAGQSKWASTPRIRGFNSQNAWARQMEQSEDAAGRCVVTVRTNPYGPSVLVIDDNQGLVELLRRYLTGLMCRVWTATNGSAGLELAAQLSPDAIILDVMMPEMDGWELLQRLRSHPSTVTIPVIICSVFNDPELAYSLGASTILTKPVKTDDLVDALRQLKSVVIRRTQ